MTDIIKELQDKTQKLDMKVSLAYGQNGQPCIGIRGIPDMLVSADYTCWLISGTLKAKDSSQQISSMKDVFEKSPDTMKLELHAQAAVCGSLVSVELGTRTVIKKIVGENFLDDIILHCEV